MYFEKMQSKFHCGFQKGFSTQYCISLMLEKWKHAVHKKKVLKAFLTDLSKSSDCIYN